VFAKLSDRFMGFRVSADDETIGVDFTQHADSAYAEGVHGYQPLRRSYVGRRPPRAGSATRDGRRGLRRKGS
jgi:ammonium transporter, Amt family